MNNSLEINNTSLQVKEFAGQRVVTFKDIDKVHDRPDGTARRNFTKNKKFFIENEDYFKITRQNSMDVFHPLDITIPPKGIILLTESGYLLLVKSFTDSLSWEVQRKLVTSYFRYKEDQGHDNTSTEALRIMADILTTMQQDINTLKEQQQKKSLPEKKYSRWKTNTFAKLNTLHSYVNEHSDENLKLSEIIHLVIEETEDTYGIDLNDYVSAYKSEFNLENNPYAIDVINHYKDVRDMFTLTLDTIMEKLHISKQSHTSENIFTILAAQLDEEE